MLTPTGCVRTETPAYRFSSRDRNLCYEYRFYTNQEFKGQTFNYWYLAGEKSIKVNMQLDDTDLSKGLVVLKTSFEPDHMISLIPDSRINPKPIPQAIDKVVADYEQYSLQSSNIPKGAIYDFLTRARPRITGHDGGSLINNNSEDKISQITQAILNLDHSYLPIQGPPGTGKTYAAARVIQKLVSSANKVAVTSNSHKAINNLVLATARYLQQTRTTANLVCCKDTDKALSEFGIKQRDNADLVDEVNEACVIGSTAWGFSRDDLVGQFDYLFVDEAGQVSVANLIAMSRCCKNLVLIGDQMQLSQPVQGSHPDESGLSILNYLLHDQATIDDSMGIFLDTSYRMHSRINQLISNAVYDGKLRHDPANDRQSVLVPSDYRQQQAQGYLHTEVSLKSKST